MPSTPSTQHQTPTTRSRSDVQSDTPLGLALAQLAIAASHYYEALMGHENWQTQKWSIARAEVLAAALAVGREVENEVRRIADQHREWPVTRTGDRKQH